MRQYDKTEGVRYIWKYMKSIDIYDTIITTNFTGVKEAVRGHLWLRGAELDVVI